MSTPSPILSPEQLLAIAQQILDVATADTVSVSIKHVADGVARILNGRVRLTSSGDVLEMSIKTQFGQRTSMELQTNQIDLGSLRRAVRYLERVAHDLPGDLAPQGIPVPPHRYLPYTTWNETTAAVFSEARHRVIPALVGPIRDAGFMASAYVGVHLASIAHHDRGGNRYAGQETDSEIVATGWSTDERAVGWAGQTSRDWSVLDPGAVASEAARLTRLALNPVAFEPGRHTAILARPAVAQLVRGMNRQYFAGRNAWHNGPLYNRAKDAPRIGERIWDARLTLTSDPNDPVASFLPFNYRGDPLVPMTWVKDGVMKNVSFSMSEAATYGITPSNDSPEAVRMSGGTTSLEQMIANCELGIYVNRFAQIQDAFGAFEGELQGVTDGGCFLVRNGKIEKSIKNLQFRESPWLAFNRIMAVGPAERTAFGYSPWSGAWPVPPTIVPSMMIQDFNFTALSDAV